MLSLPILSCLWMSSLAGAAQTTPPAGEFSLPDNMWTKVADVPADPLGRDLDPGRGAYWCFEPASGTFLRYGGYTPTECNALWSFDLAARRWENPLKVDYAWPPPADRPGAGAWWSMAWDGRRKVVWLCGGSGLAARKHPELFNDIWQYDPVRKIFTPMRSTGFPGYSASNRIVYDSKNDLIIRAPAYDSEWSAMHNRDTTWVYDPNTNAWQGRPTPGGPQDILAGAMVFDPVAGKTVFLGGDAQSTAERISQDFLASTWTYEAATNTWANIDSTQRPPARVVAGAAWDPENRRVVICGGVGGKAGEGYGYLYRGGGVMLTDTWVLDLATGQWQKLDVGAPIIPKLPGEVGTRFEHFCAMDYDAKNKALVLSAPTVGVWALRYRPAAAVPLPELKLSALPPAPAVVPPTVPVFKQAPPNRKLLDLPENTWLQLEGGTSLGGAQVPMIYDEATGYCLKYGGCNNGGTTFAGGYGNDLSAYDPATERWIALRWVDPCGPPRPENGCTRSYVYDPVRKVNWLCGGTSGNALSFSLPPGYAGTLENGTWCYDGLRDRFDLIPSQGGPVPHGSARVSCCYDRGNNLFLFHTAMFGPAGKSWSWNTATVLPVISYPFACYVDSLRGMLAVVEGGPKTFLYEATKNAWTDLAPGGDPLPRIGAGTGIPTAVAYDPGNDVALCILMGQAYVYHVKTNLWKQVPGATPDVTEQLTFDTRHKVFLATGAMGKHMWAFRYRNAVNVPIDPGVASVTSATADGGYGTGAVVNVTVNFTTPVTLAGGSLGILLDTGAVVSIAPFGPTSSGSGTYTVAPGQNSPDLSAATPLSLSPGATLRDAAGKDATLTIPVGKNLADLKNLVIDTKAPTIPMNLQATPVSSSQIDLSWNTATDDVAVAGYRIYRGGTPIADSASTSYSNTGLNASTSYSYTVAAYDAAGNVSAQSSSASTTTPVAGGGGGGGGGVPPAVLSLVLLDGDTGLPIAGFNPLMSGAILNLGTLPTRHLDFEATMASGAVGSVVFGYDGNGSHRTDNVAPYDFAGGSGGAWTPTVGAHSVSATPYSQAGGTGTAGTGLILTFTVIDDPATVSTNGGGGSGSGGGGGVTSTNGSGGGGPRGRSCGMGAVAGGDPWLGGTLLWVLMAIGIACALTAGFELRGNSK